MKLRGVLAGFGGSVAGIAAANAILRKRAGPLQPPLGGEPTTYRWRGLDVSVTEAGTPTDQDLVLFHGLGMAATSREFVHVFDELAADFHVLAPDFPGFGRSERPPLSYSARLYEDFVREFVRDRTDRPVCLAAGVSGAYVVSVHRELDLDRLLLIAPMGQTTQRQHSLVRAILRLPLLGTGAFNVLTARPLVRHRARHRDVVEPTAVSTADVAYRWATAHQPGARYAPASLLTGFLDPRLDIGGVLSASDTPTTLIWGRDARRPPLRDGRRLADRANCKLVVIDRAGSSPHVDQPSTMVEVVTQELVTSSR